MKLRRLDPYRCHERPICAEHLVRSGGRERGASFDGKASQCTLEDVEPERYLVDFAKVGAVLNPASPVALVEHVLHLPSVLRNLAIVVDDPVGRAAPAPAPPPRAGEAGVIVIIGRPDRPSSVVAPNRNLPTTIKLKKKWRRAAADLTIVRPVAAAPPRRPEQVEQPRARANTAKGVKGGPIPGLLRSGCRRRRPGSIRVARQLASAMSPRAIVELRTSSHASNSRC
jgi:hypothetical protein